MMWSGSQILKKKQQKTVASQCEKVITCIFAFEGSNTISTVRKLMLDTLVPGSLCDIGH